MIMDLRIVFIFCTLLGGAPEENPLAVRKPITVWMVGSSTWWIARVGEI